MLKLIGIENFAHSEKEIQSSRRHANIYKILNQDAQFWIYEGYEIKDYRIVKRPKPILNGKLYSSGNPMVDICAIVGKNGSGKSSLIELYLRIMNNLAYVCHRAINDGKQFNTEFVGDIFSCVYFEDESSGVCYTVKQHGSKLSYYENGVRKFQYNYNKPIETPGFVHDRTPDRETAKICLESLCYTMVVNYSAYSYNTEDYLPEWNTAYNNSAQDQRTEAERMEDWCWIDSLFHKNDGYQLPVVLNPFRESGMVDYNNERELTQERLYKMTIQDKNPLSFVFDGLELDSYVFDVDNDLNPVPSRKYDSYKVLSQLLILRAINELKSEVSFKKADAIGEIIIKAWNRCFGVKLDSYIVEGVHEDGVKRNDSVLRALNYIVYKTLKIAHTYPKYQYYNDIGNDTSKIENFVKELYKDNSHITLKIRRSAAYIVFQHYDIGEISIEDFRNAVANAMKTSMIDSSSIDTEHKEERFDDLEEYGWTEDDLLPSSSFKVNMYLHSIKDRQNKISLSAMSSGQRQMINVVTTFAYHMSNIDSVWDRKTAQSDELNYKNICVFIDEMDLYMHPEYQTQYVDLLLKTIDGLQLKHIEGVQIICASHSPFILSDIPRKNVLYLEKGEIAKDKERKRTFGANIGDLLCDSFFMTDGLIGCFSKETIISLVEWLEKGAKGKSKWTLEKAEEVVSIVDDRFIAEQLDQMLSVFRKK